MADDNNQSGWHLDKKFAFTILSAIIIQIATGIWYASKIDSRVAFLETQSRELAKLIEANKAWQTDQRIRVWNRVEGLDASVSVLSGDVRAMTVQMGFVLKQLDRLTDAIEAEKKKEKP